MAFERIIKNKQYFKRYQVKYRRRREGKTDYKRRSKLTRQDKNKYNSPKYRFVVRITNRDVVCQIAYAKIVGDVILTAAYAHELPKFGMPVGLTNYAACYATGLLCARRLLKKLKLDEHYSGLEEVTGEMFTVEEAVDGPKPFYALLDVGLARTSTGARVFAALKGAVDGGLNIPHNNKRFRGYDPDTKEYDAEEARGFILGEHVKDYMEDMQEEDPEKYAVCFSKYVENEIEPDDLEDKYLELHEAIRENPEHTKKVSTFSGTPKRYNEKKITLEQRRENVATKLAAMAEAEDEDDEE
jgi:large subunit ribosomal protein L5e